LRAVNSSAVHHDTSFYIAFASLVPLGRGADEGTTDSATTQEQQPPHTLIEGACNMSFSVEFVRNSTLRSFGYNESLNEDPAVAVKNINAHILENHDYFGRVILKLNIYHMYMFSIQFDFRCHSSWIGWMKTLRVWTKRV